MSVPSMPVALTVPLFVRLPTAFPEFRTPVPVRATVPVLVMLMLLLSQVIQEIELLIVAAVHCLAGGERF
jgi:hypothetical protein